MSLIRHPWKQGFFLLVLVGLISGCGVKGKPLPPLEPVPMGDGTLKANRDKNPKKPAQTKPVVILPEEPDPGTTR